MDCAGVNFLFCSILVWANALNMNRIAYVGINQDKGISQQKWDDLRCSHEKRHMFVVSRKNHLNDPGDGRGFRVFEFIVNIKKKRTTSAENTY